MTHPSRAFAWAHDAELRAFVATRAFAQISIAIDGRPVAAHAPLAIGADGSIRFHLARANRLTAHLDGAPALATVVGDDAYISPDWYGTEDQVPTWNYRLVEIEGIARRLGEADLIDQLDRLSAAQEALLAPKPAWTMAKLSPARNGALLKGIVGFAIDAPLLRGVAKLGQNKSASERAGVEAALTALGRHDVARAMAAGA
ncbi:FMN-binding negative transcriptional regulator [Sphingomonas bacterium]|uniref:FMN-binding negative transcriptional regulator n=1 Tax=Sphingomonas bacterium TaxID=1895847 RepID=UPI0015758DE8|nr:FMN-binding negative transcriptional regulator [Sphingomonas bacterium]